MTVRVPAANRSRTPSELARRPSAPRSTPAFASSPSERPHTRDQRRARDRARLPVRVGLVHDDESHARQLRLDAVNVEPVRNSTTAGARTAGFTLCVCPASSPVMRGGNRRRDRSCRISQPGIGFRSVHHQRRHADRREARARNPERGHHRGVVGQGMGDRFELAPDPRHQPHHHDHRRRRADHVLHEVLHRAAAVAVGDQALEADPRARRRRVRHCRPRTGGS